MEAFGFVDFVDVEILDQHFIELPGTSSRVGSAEALKGQSDTEDWNNWQDVSNYDDDDDELVA
jgi:hypothetical protein